MADPEPGSTDLIPSSALPASAPANQAAIPYGASLDTLDSHVTAWQATTNPRTARLRLAVLRRFQAWAESPTVVAAIWRLISHPAGSIGTGIAPTPGFCEEVLEQYRRHLEQAVPQHQRAGDDRGYGVRSVRTYCLQLQSLLKTLRNLGWITWTPALHLPRHVSYSKRAVAGCGLDGFRRMLEAASQQASPARERDRCILILLWRGLRVGELVDIDLAHLRLEADPPTIGILGKWRQEREDIDIAANQVQAIRAWLQVRGEEPGPLLTRLDRGTPKHAVEPARQRRERRDGGGKRLATDGVRKTMLRLGDVAGMARDACHPHAIRHTVATHLLEKTDGNVRLVQSFLRLSSVEIVAVYDDYRRRLGLAGARLADVSLGEIDRSLPSREEHRTLSIAFDGEVTAPN